MNAWILIFVKMTVGCVGGGRGYHEVSNKYNPKTKISQQEWRHSICNDQTGMILKWWPGELSNCAQYEEEHPRGQH